MDMKELKRLYGDKLTFWGGVTNENLILGTPERVQADALYALRYGAPGGGFIYGASHSLAVGTTPENLAMMKQMRDQYGVYPIRIPEGKGMAPGFPAPVTLPERFR
jgi:uroporphyrinogen decarboxylase